jgi:periplasmic protein TonB
MMLSPLRRFCLLTFLGTLTLAPALAQNGQKPPKLVTPKEDPNRIFDALAEPATPVGGGEAYGRYLDDHLNYPTRALEKRVQGTDSVSFVVEKNGTISNVTLVKGFDPDCDAEALRVVKAGPKWKPGKHRGQVARQRVTLPIVFALAPATGQALRSDSATIPAAARPTASTSSPTVVTNTPIPPPSTDGLKLVQPEKGAQPVGGTDAFFAWVQKNIQYPEAAKRQHLEGKVRVEFTIEPDGSLTNIKALNHLAGGLEQEAIRVIKSAPKWEPAMYQGQPMRQKMVVPVIFQL